MAYRSNETDKQIVDLERSVTDGAIIVNENPNSVTASIRQYDGGHGAEKIQDGDVVIKRTRSILGSHNDHDAARGETKLIGRCDAGNAY